VAKEEILSGKINTVTVMLHPPLVRTRLSPLRLSIAVIVGRSENIPNGGGTDEMIGRTYHWNVRETFRRRAPGRGTAKRADWPGMNEIVPGTFRERYVRVPACVHRVTHYCTSVVLVVT
jgi:hypothetical protein